MDIDIFIKDVKTLTQEVINNHLSTNFLPFSKINKFPYARGVYFVYENQDDVLIYIGSGSKKKINTRCRQYINNGSGGDSFRKKVARHYNLEINNTFDFIINNFKILYIDADEIEPCGILLLERACIDLLKPPLND